MEITDKKTYYYELPEELIAQKPLEPRDSSRLLVYHKDTKEIEHKIFHDITQFLKKGDVLVINNSRVLPARLYGIKEDTNAKIEVLLQKRIDLFHWEILAKPTKRLSVGTKIVFCDKLAGIITKIKTYGNCEIEFKYSGSFEAILHEIGLMPLPHYIREKLADKERYQTVYSKEEGSSAAPTAGLHFTNELLEKIKAMGVEILEVMLHVGLGTFRPVKEENILKHEMHYEYFEITEDVANKINLAKMEGRRVIAVGTTSVRVLESSATENGKLSACKIETNIFIYR
ncbi:MAG: tRNA preQ1(34) S-adenosylmethionine ribosyltransferase-isomerase QueA [Clostridia bacterium]